MGGVFVLALLAIVAARVIPAAVRLRRALRADGAADRAAAVLLLAVRALPAERADWGQAMIGELDELREPRSRWRFSLGCAGAVATLRARDTLGGGHRDGVVVRAVVLAAVLAALALGAYGLIRYPHVRAGDRAWAAPAALLVVLLAYVGGALGLSRGMTPGAVLARRYGLLGGLAVGAAWLVVIFPTSALKEWVLVPLTAAMLGPAIAAGLAARASRDAGAATAAAIWCGLLGGLLVFVVWASATYLHDGRPFDPQLVRDFHASGATDLTAYAVSDNLGGALGMLLVIPTVALAAGSLTARMAASRSRRRAPDSG